MPKWILGLAGAVVIALAVGLWAFEPWTKFTSSTVDEALPIASADIDAGADSAEGGEAADVPAAQTEKGSEKAKKDEKAKRDKKDEVAEQTAPPPTAEPKPEPEPEPEPEPVPEVVELASGQFEDAEYDTNGVATIIRLADGGRFVRLEGFSTSDGPDVFVGLSTSPSGGAWGSYDDIRYVQLGGLKATNGNQNYEIPADVDLGGFKSVVIWCDRFNVAFGTAPVSL